MKKTKVVILGCGNMGSAVALGAHKANAQLFDFYCYTPSHTKAQHLAESTNGTHIKSYQDIPKDANILVLGFKPQQFESAASELKKYIPKECIVISLLAGIGMKKHQDALNTDKVLRVMPNTPIKIAQGLSLFLRSNTLTQEDYEICCKLFEASSQIVNASTEEEFNRLIPIIGCTPALLFQYVRSYAQKLKEFGMNEQQARNTSVEAFYSAATLMHQSDETLDTLIDQVCSKGGVTIEAVNSIAQSNIDEIVSKAYDKALVRNKELSQ